MKIHPLLGLLSFFLIPLPSASAITILSGPVFTPSTSAPLAGQLQLTTDVESRVSVVVDDGVSTWRRDFYDYTTAHTNILLGFKPGRANQITVNCYDKFRNAADPAEVTFITSPLPVDFPVSTVITNRPELMEPGYSLFIVQRAGATTGTYIMAMNNSTEVVWYKPWTPNDYEARQLTNGNLFLEQQSPSNNFLEMNMLGTSVRTWTPPTAYPVGNHEGYVTDHGTILYHCTVKRTVTNFPSSTACSPVFVTTSVADNPIVEISMTNSALLNVWSPMDLLDPKRVTFLTYQFGTGLGIDNYHANAVIEDPTDNSLIISLRDQNAVFKVLRQTGQLKWILGPPNKWGTNWQQYLLTPQGTPFDWNYGQHAPDLTPDHTLFVYNNGNTRASICESQVADQNNYSSAEEFSIDETNMTVSEVWNSAWQTNQDRLFTAVLGKAQWLPKTDHVFVTFGSVAWVNGVRPNPAKPAATMVRLREYTHDPIPQIVFDLSFFDTVTSGYICYRARRIHDLYVHPAQPVVDLNIINQNDVRTLQFSGDPMYTYEIQSSIDLENWTSLGNATQEEDSPNFDFMDEGGEDSTVRYYRVVTN